MSRRPRHRRAAPRSLAAAPEGGRIAALDALRGIGICLMVAYHFTFDLAWFHMIEADFYHDPFWLFARAVIVTIFLGLVGVSLVLAKRAHPGPQPFWRRIALIAACAILVTIASYLTFPQTFITFGILHAIAVASVLARPLIDLPRVALALGAAIIVAGTTVQVPVFDLPWLNWVGMMTHKPATEDYVPLFPWLGVVLIGVAASAALPGVRSVIAPVSRRSPAWLAWLGRHSLIIYLVHQPLLIGALRVWSE
ncbi:MAG TPA: heparan-alpha-glucosaminide N-acetyltransferase [Casimicrobiaceae bacterium]|nr:heparan-alpha-glucosaminide N-acetyltransferase [Casimicrobiaceae bacterium]